jgi:hypothetical protein
VVLVVKMNQRRLLVLLTQAAAVAVVVGQMHRLTLD